MRELYSIRISGIHTYYHSRKLFEKLMQRSTFEVIISYLGIEELMQLQEVSQIFTTPHRTKIIKRQMRSFIFIVIYYNILRDSLHDHVLYIGVQLLN